MSPRYLFLGFIVAVASLAARGAQSSPHARSKDELRRIILHSRHLGAHGLGYNDRSLIQLGGALTSADIPNLISLLDDEEVRVGVQFALASQCDATIQPVQQAADQNEKTAWLDAEHIMDLIAAFQGCSSETQAKARATRNEIDAAAKERQAKRAQELQQKAANDARIQRNALKMTDPEQKKTLTRAEREEAFRRSVKAAGLENPQTREQKALVDRMYRTMVLDEPPAQKNQ